MARDPKYDVLFEPIQLGPEDAAQPLLAGPALQRRRLGQARDAGRVPRHEGRGRLGRGLHRGLHDHARRDVMPLGRRPSSGTQGDVRNLSLMCDAHPRARLARRRRAAPPGRPGGQRRDPRARPTSSRRSRTTSTSWPTVGRWTSERSSQLRREHVDGAKRAREAGFDLITLFCGLGTFPIFFLYPFYNKRTDEYGGSFENRIRFTREVLEDMREAIDDCAIGMPVRHRHPRRALRLRRSRHPRRRGGRAVHRGARPPGRLLGHQHRHPELGRGRRLVAVLRDEPRGRVHASRQGGVTRSRSSTSAASPTPT